MAQRQRRDWRDSYHYRAISGKSRLRGAAEPLSAGAGVTRMYLRWGVAGGILGATEHRGCQPGQEHLGGPTRPMGESDLNPWCCLVARWILVWATSPNRCLQLLPACACGTVQAKIHAPTTTTKESVA